MIRLLRRLRDAWQSRASSGSAFGQRRSIFALPDRPGRAASSVAAIEPAVSFPRPPAVSDVTFERFRLGRSAGERLALVRFLLDGKYRVGGIAVVFTGENSLGVEWPTPIAAEAGGKLVEIDLDPEQRRLVARRIVAEFLAAEDGGDGQ